MDPMTASTLDAVGGRLKQLRLRRDVTLTDLAHDTGISVSTLSRLEAGLRRPTLEQLLPLARYHGVTIDSLVDAPRTSNPRLDLRPLTCDDGSVVIPLTRRPGGIQAHKFVLPAASQDEEPRLHRHERHDWASVTPAPAGSPAGAQPYTAARPAAGQEAERRLHGHEGHDWAYVLHGTLRRVLGEHGLRRAAGEAVEFDTRTPNWFGATPDGPV